MSYILDALRKSETERSLGDYVSAKDPAFDISDRPPSRLRSAAIVAAVGTIGGLALFWFFFDRPAAVTVSTIERPAAVAAESSAERATLPPGQARTLARETFVPPKTASNKSAPSSVKGAPPASARGDRGDGVKFLRAMPASFRNRLPKLEINIHVYSPEPAQQILFINNREVKPGQRVDGGALLEAITPDGAILRLDDTRFKLPRPS